MPYNATTDAEPGALREDAETTANIRILDPALVTDAFAQLEQFRQYYQFAAAPRRRPLRDRRRDPGHRDRGARAQPGRARRLADAGTTTRSSTRTATASSRRTATSARPTASRCSSSRASRASGDLGDFEPRVYFGESSPDVLDRRRPRGRDRASSSTTRRAATTTATSNATTTFDGRRRAEARQRLQEARLRDQVPVGADLPLRRRDRRVADPLRPQPDRARAEGRAVPDARQRRLPRGRRRPDRVDRRRLHDERRTTRTRTSSSSSSAIADTYTPTPAFAIDDINYIRNSVKATVDAYDG